MKLGAMAVRLGDYIGLKLILREKKPSAMLNLETILQQINSSRDAEQIIRLANEYRIAVVELYGRGEDQHMAQERLLELTNCLEYHPLADELHHFKLTA